MGWITTRKPKGEGIIEFLARDTMDCSNEHGTWKVLKGKVVKNVAYMAVRRSFPEESGRAAYVFAAVYKVQIMPRAEYNFGYKDMDESCLPFYYDCPNDLLDMLSPTEDKNSLEWRAECRKRNAASAAVKLTKGAIVEFTEAIRFKNGFSANVFRVEDARRNLVLGKQPNGEFGVGMCIIKGLRDYIVRGAAKIIGVAAVEGGAA